MSRVGNIDWRNLLDVVCRILEEQYQIALEVDTDEVAELEELATKSLADYRLS